MSSAAAVDPPVPPVSLVQSPHRRKIEEAVMSVADDALILGGVPFGELVHHSVHRCMNLDELEGFTKKQVETLVRVTIFLKTINGEIEKDTGEDGCDYYASKLEPPE